MARIRFRNHMWKENILDAQVVISAIKINVCITAKYNVWVKKKELKIHVYNLTG